MPIQGWIRLLAGGGEGAQVVWEQAVALLPATPLRQQISLPASAGLRLQLVDQEGKVLLDYDLQD
jgi:hypothetical protein